MRLRKLLKIVGSAIIMLFLLNSCEMLGLDPNGNGNGDGNEVEATDQQAAQYTELVLSSVGLLFDNFTGEETNISLQSDDGSVVINGTFTPQTGAISFTVELNDFTDGTSNVRVATLAGNPISVTGIVGEDAGSLSVTGAANLINTDFASITLNVTVSWQNEGPTVSGTVMIDNKSFNAASLGIELGDGGDGGDDDYTIDDIAGVWKLDSISEYDPDDGNWYTDYFPMDLAYEMTYDYDNDIEGDSDIDGDGFADTYEMKQYIEITSFEEMMIYLAIEFANTDTNVTVEALQNMGYPIISSGVYTLDGSEEMIYIAEDGMSIESTHDHVNGMGIELTDGGDTLILTGGNFIEVTLTREPESVLDSAQYLTDMYSVEYGVVEEFLSGGDGGGDLTIDDVTGVWELYSVTEYDEYDQMWYDDYFPMDLAFAFTYDYDNDVEGDSDIDGDGFADTYEMGQFIEITSNEEMYTYLDLYFDNTDAGVTVADLQSYEWPVVETGVYTLDGFVDMISIEDDGMTLYSSSDHIDGLEVELADEGNTMIISGMGVEVILNRVDYSVLDTSQVLTDMESAEYNIIEMFLKGEPDGMPYPADGTAEELAAYYPLASVAEIGNVFEAAAMDMDPYAEGSITGDGFEITGTYTDAQNYTYTITLTDFYPDYNYDVMLSGETTGVATLDVNGDGTATLVSTGDVTISGMDTMNSTVSFDLTLGIIAWEPDGTVTGTVTLDGTAYDAETELMFDFGMEE